jgi:hypothetical protein
MHIFELFRAPIQAAVGQLSLREPPPERRHVDDVQSIQNRERRRAHPHCKQNKRNASRFAVKINGQKEAPPCAAWLSAPATRPKPPSKFRHEAR